MSTTSKLLIAGAVAGAGVGIYAYSKMHWKASSASVGDTVLVQVSSLPAGALPALIPPGIGYIAVVVTKKPFFSDTIDGYIGGYVPQLSPLVQTPFGLPGQYPVQIKQEQVTGVYRAGQLIA